MMKRSVLGVIIAVISLVAIVGIVIANRTDEKPQSTATSSDDSMANMGQPSSSNEPQMIMAQNTVEISDFSFKASKITVKKGSTVTWTNRDSARHDITPDSQTNDFKASKLLDKGESYSFTFNTVGTYSYFCSPHPYMKGSVEVTE